MKEEKYETFWDFFLNAKISIIHFTIWFIIAYCLGLIVGR